MKFIIQGGKPLSGEIKVRGAKNSALKVMASSLLFKNPITVNNVPLIEDVFRMIELLKGLGVKVRERAHGRSLTLDSHTAHGYVLDKDIALRFRASIVLAGPLLARQKRVLFPHPGGCVIGKRTIDIFLGGWRLLGAKIRETKDGYYDISAKRLRGCDYTFQKVSVTATETLMMTAVLAEGKTILRNVACEPEIPALAEFLNRSGAKIKGAGTSTVEIIGTKGRLLNAKESFKVLPDRIEAGSFLILGAAIGKNLKIKNCNPEHLSVLIAVLGDVGVKVLVGPQSLTVSCPKKLFRINIKTDKYPGFPTDLQAPFTVLMTQAEGQSMIFETVFEDRLNYIEDLNRMGANIVMCDPHRILVHGPTTLHGREIESPDIRAGLAFVITALIAKGFSEVKNVYQIDRGYEKIDERLEALGANIKRLE